MCAVCGCGHDHLEAHPVRADGSQDHHHVHHHHQDPDGTGPVAFNDTHLVEIEKSILSKNDRYAEANRERFADQRVLALNLVSSPGAGKTTLLVETVKSLKGKIPVGVIEGDQETANDAERIQAAGVDAVQINTGRGCHLDAHMVGHALDDLPPLSGGVVFIENVGNLVCPAAFDLGEAAKVVILSVTEGDDKPLKYPDMFAAADVMIVSKVDLLPYVDFDVDHALERARRINPQLECLQLSVSNGEGMAEWLNWIVKHTVTTTEIPPASRRSESQNAAGDDLRHA